MIENRYSRKLPIYPATYMAPPRSRAVAVTPVLSLRGEKLAVVPGEPLAVSSKPESPVAVLGEDERARCRKGLSRDKIKHCVGFRTCVVMALPLCSFTTYGFGALTN
jgi:hypothetical protein